MEKGPCELKRLEVGSFENNCYLLSSFTTREAVIVDPAAEAGKIIEASASFSVRYILVTHGHFDHIGALKEVTVAVRAPVGIHAADSHALPEPPDFFLKDGDIIRLGDCTLEIIHTPGHTPGGVCILMGNHLVSGDTIFPGGPGNTDLPGADRIQLLESIRKKIFPLPGETVIHPGHGLPGTVGKERAGPHYER